MHRLISCSSDLSSLFLKQSHWKSTQSAELSINLQGMLARSS